MDLTQRDKEIREKQKAGPFLACGPDGSVRSVEPGSKLRAGEVAVQVSGARSLKDAVAIMRAADRWNALDEAAREALLEVDVESYGRLRLAAKRVRFLSDEEYNG